MSIADSAERLDELKQVYPDKFVSADEVFKAFGCIHRGDRIFLGTGCGEPQFLVRSLIDYVKSKPKAFSDVEVFHIWTLGGTFKRAPYADEKVKGNFRHNSFFIGHGSRDAVNKGVADYTPIFASEVPDLFYRNVIPIDVALVQTSLPDSHGYVSLGVSVDTCKAVVDKAHFVIVQINPSMPRTHGDGFIHIDDVDFAVVYEEPLLEYREEADADSSVVQRIAKHVSSLIQDGDTIQVGYGTIPNAVLPYLEDKKHLGVHSEVLSDGIAYLMKKGVVDNTLKTINRGKTVAAFCLGKKETYEFLHDNPKIEFRTIDYTNNPLNIARNKGMTAINSALEIDLTGQATAESIGRILYAGIGGQADFMRGAILAAGGKSILAFESTAMDGTISRIVPFLKDGASVTLNRGDIHYVVTEYGIAYLHGKNIRERAMELISIAHPRVRPWLIQEAKKRGLIYKDQAFVPGEYPEHLETYRTAKTGLEIFLRPLKISDEPLMKEFFHLVSDKSIYHRFSSMTTEMPHEKLQEFVVVDYAKAMGILAVVKQEEKEIIVGFGQYFINQGMHNAEVALVVRDDYQNHGIGTELLSYLTYLAKKDGLLGFVAEVMPGNESMLHLFANLGFDIKERSEEGTFIPRLVFNKE